MALWGTKGVREDDAEQAIRAALDMQAEIHKFIPEAHGLSLKMRIGLNTGPVLLGPVGLKDEFSAIGDTVNLASRLEHAAPVGGVLISHSTYCQVRGIFEVLPQPPLTVKGKSEPIQTYVIQRAKPHGFRLAMRGVEGTESRLIGREAEMLTLQNAFRDVVEDQQIQVITIMGDAGVGKSRLLYEFEKWLELQPFPIHYLKGRAMPEMQNRPYSLLRDMFGFRFEIFDSDSSTTVLEKFRAGMAGHLDTEQADLVGQLVGFDFSASPAVQALLGSSSFNTLAIAYLTNYIRAVSIPFQHSDESATKMAVILLEDLHWADDSSLDWLDHLATTITEARLLVIGLARPALLERRPHWGEGREAYTRLELKPLSKRDSRILVSEILQKAVFIPDEIRNLVVEGAEGNPFYIEELIRMLVDDGVIVRATDQWDINMMRLKERHIPLTLAEVLQARLDSLPQEEKRLLQQASVIGRVFWDRALEVIVAADAADSADQEQITSQLNAARNRELIFRREHSTIENASEYIFKHALLRDVAYDTVLLKLRRRYHQQVAMWLEQNTGGRINEYLGLIAWHYKLADEKVKAAAYWQLAGEAADKIGALREAIDAFQQALKMLSEENRTERAKLLVRLGEAHRKSGALTASQESLESGLALARETGERKIIAEALNGLSGTVMVLNTPSEAQTWAKEALVLAQEINDRTAEAIALRLLGEAAERQSNYIAATEHYEASLKLYREIGDQWGIASSLYDLSGVIRDRDGNYSAAASYMKESLGIFRKIGDQWKVTDVLNGLGLVTLDQGNYAAAAQYYEEGLAISKEIGELPGIATGFHNLANVAFNQSDYTTATHHNEKSLAIRRKIGSRMGISNSLNSLGDAARMQGDYALAKCYYEESLALRREIGYPRGIVYCLANLGHTAAAMGNEATANRYYHEALTGALAINAAPMMVYTLIGIAGIQTREGNLILAAELLGLILNHVAYSQYDASIATPILSTLQASLPANEIKAALERGQALSLEKTAQNLVDTLKAGIGHC